MSASPGLLACESANSSIDGISENEIQSRPSRFLLRPFFSKRSLIFTQFPVCEFDDIFSHLTDRLVR